MGFRAKENAGLPPLVWNETLAKWSQKHGETLKGNCQQIHSTSPYGENLMEGTPGLTWKITVDGWSEEKKNYHFDSDTCDAGKMCGHYKAVVWKTTTSVAADASSATAATPSSCAATGRRGTTT